MNGETHRARTKRTSRRLRKRTIWLTLAGVLVLGVLALSAAANWRMRQGLGAQVVARAGGVDISREDLRAEARAQGRSNAAQLTPDLVQAVIARTLLAQEARRRGLQHSPDYPSDRRRAEQQVLTSELIRDLPPPASPSPEQINGFIAAHPERFAQRRRLQLEELSYRAAGAPAVQELSFEQARSALTAAGVPFQVFATSVIVADLPPALQHALAASGGTVASWRDGDVITDYNVVSSEPAPVVGDAATVSAGETLRTASREAQIRSLIGRLRVRGEVVIRPGYGP